MYARPQLGTLLSRVREPVRSIQIVAGPRQVGKTTMVRQLLDRIPDGSWTFEAVDQPIPDSTPDLLAVEILINDPLRPHDAVWLLQRWGLARLAARKRQQHGTNEPYLLVIDEIQKIPNWSEHVKGLWDADRAEKLAMHVVLLGSSPLLVQKGLTESLAGRYELIPTRHWSLAEMQDAFDVSLEQYIFYGGYPGAAGLIQDENRWRRYVLASLIQPSIEKDVLALSRVEKPALMKLLFELAANYSGQLLAYNNMRGHLQDAGNTTTLAHYLNLLAHSGLVSGLHKHSVQVIRQRASSPKLNVHNTALMAAGSGYSFAQAQSDRAYWGRLVESCVGAHLINTAEEDCAVRYWRESPHEVDFVLVRGRLITAIEVKSGKKVGPVAGLDRFGQQFAMTRRLVVGDATGCDVSIAEFLSEPAAYWLNIQA